MTNTKERISKTQLFIVDYKKYPFRECIWVSDAMQVHIVQWTALRHNSFENIRSK